MTYELKTRSSVRARLFLGGTYFRARKVGVDGNNISIEAVEKDGKTYLVICNHNTEKFDADLGLTLTGPATATILSQSLEWNEGVIIKNLTTTPTAQIYSISSQIAAEQPVMDLTPIDFTFGKLLHIPGKLSAKLALNDTGVLPTDEIRISGRYFAYELTQITVDVPTGPADPETGTVPTEPVTGWDVDALRAAVNQDCLWVEMFARGTDGQDLAGKDDPVFSTFDKAYLKGGDGMPENPVGLPVGTETSMVYLAVSEDYMGNWAPTNQVYIWKGEGWKPYSP